MSNQSTDKFLAEAVKLSIRNIQTGEGGPFGAVIVKNGQIIAWGNNRVTSTNDPTAHAEVVAIREACQKLGTFGLEGCELYSSCEPCPMCLSAIYWARIEKVFYANTKDDAAKIGFDDAFIYDEIKKPPFERRLFMERIKNKEAWEAFEQWAKKSDKQEY